LGDPNSEVGSAAEAALAEMTPFGKEDIPILCAGLQNPEVSVRAYAASALDKMEERYCQ